MKTKVNTHGRACARHSATYAALLIFLAAAPGLSAAAQDRGPKTEISLRECQEMALENNPYVLNSSLDILAAQARKREAVAEYFPKVSVNAFVFHAFDPLLEIGVRDIFGTNDFSNNLESILAGLGGEMGFDPIYSTLKHGVSATVSAIQPVFAGGRIVNGNKLAALGLEAARLKHEISLRTTSEDVEKGYWQVVSLEEKMRTLEQMQSLVDTLYRDVHAAVSAGLATENDLLQVKLQKSRIRSGKIQAKNGIRLAKMNLFNSIGQPYNPYSTIRNDSIPYIDDIILSDRLEELEAPESCYRPEEEIAAGQAETQLLDLSVRSKKIEKKMTVGEAMPQIGVGAAYGYGNLIDKGQMNGAVFATVQIPISDWGKTARRIQRYDYQIEMAENERDYLNAQIILQVRKLWMDLTASWDQLQVAKESVETARASVRQLEAYYKAGMSPLSDLLQAQTQLQQCSDEYIDQCISYRTTLQEYLGKAGFTAAEESGETAQ